MGTRHLTVVKKDNKNVVAQYGQWDGYPSGQGTTIIKFLQNLDIAKFEEQLKRVEFLTKENYNQYFKDCYKSVGIDENTEYFTQDESEAIKKAFPENHRDTGASILDLILNTTKEKMFLVDDSEFRKDGLFCEYVHFVDLDTYEYKIYRSGTRPIFKTSIHNPLTLEEFKILCDKKKW